jgi:DNA-binding NarL/FixJ family response regulator
MGNSSSTSVCRVLCVCSTEAAAQKVDQALTLRQGSLMEFTRVGTMLDGLGELARAQYDVVVAEMHRTDGSGIHAGHELRLHAPDIPLILLTSAADRDAAVAAVRDGARDFFTIEDLDSEALRRSVQKASESDNGRSGVGANRRTNARFPCRLEITWRTLEQPLKSGEGSSETLNISSKGILFTTSEQFQLGQLLQVSVNWPARLGNEVPLKLVAEGRVLRNTNGNTAMSIERYEFRTRKVAPAPPAAGPDMHSQKTVRTNC